MNETLIKMGKKAQDAETELSQLGTTEKNLALRKIADALLAHQDEILAANKLDLQDAQGRMPQKFVDRLMINQDRLQGMADGLRQVAGLADPVAKIDRGWINHAGLQILQKRVPLGVIGIIFEARPNVSVDAAGLTFKSGNAVILRGGKEALQTNTALVKVLRQALSDLQLNPDAVQLLEDTSHELAQEMMNLTDYIDVLIPRGGSGLIQTVVKNASVPVIETGAGNCHIYVDESADLAMATRIVVNAKVQRPSVCNAAEKLIVNSKVASAFLPMVAKELMDRGVELRGDDRACALVDGMKEATAEDWDEEYDDLIMSVKVVDSLDEAIKHINRHSTHHSESIITKNIENGHEFQRRINSAVVYINASTRFTDGGEFGFGAEIGISTQKLHARGPMGLDQLTTIKYEITGDGQVRE